jgi:hypothetical protein
MSELIDMPCSSCPDKRSPANKPPAREVEEEIKQIERLLIEAHYRATRLGEKVKCKRCVPRILFVVEGLEIFSKMNLFADAYRETAEKWRKWIQRMVVEEGLENNQP